MFIGAKNKRKGGQKSIKIKDIKPNIKAKKEPTKKSTNMDNNDEPSNLQILNGNHVVVSSVDNMYISPDCLTTSGGNMLSSRNSIPPSLVYVTFPVTNSTNDMLNVSISSVGDGQVLFYSSFEDDGTPTTGKINPSSATCVSKIQTAMKPENKGDSSNNDTTHWW